MLCKWQQFPLISGPVEGSSECVYSRHAYATHLDLSLEAIMCPVADVLQEDVLHSQGSLPECPALFSQPWLCLFQHLAPLLNPKTDEKNMTKQQKT